MIAKKFVGNNGSLEVEKGILNEVDLRAADAVVGGRVSILIWGTVTRHKFKRKTREIAFS